MGDKSHVGLVNAHAESNRGESHHAILAQKAVLIGVAPSLVQPGVIDDGLESLAGEKLR